MITQIGPHNYNYTDMSGIINDELNTSNQYEHILDITVREVIVNDDIITNTEHTVHHCNDIIRYNDTYTLKATINPITIKNLLKNRITSVVETQINTLIKSKI